MLGRDLSRRLLRGFETSQCERPLPGWFPVRAVVLEQASEIHVEALTPFGSRLDTLSP